MDNEVLVLEAIRGDQKAFSELIQARKEVLYRTAFIYVKNREDALDIVGETVYKAFLSIKNLKDPEKFQTWLIKILINCSLDHIRKNKRIIAVDDMVNLVQGACPEVQSDEIIDLLQAVGNLDEKCKTVILLKYFQDVTLNEISHFMEIPLGTVKTYLHKALKEMRVELKEELA